jgi:hypothetical protein
VAPGNIEVINKHWKVQVAAGPLSFLVKSQPNWLNCFHLYQKYYPSFPYEKRCTILQN